MLQISFSSSSSSCPTLQDYSFDILFSMLFPMIVSRSSTDKTEPTILTCCSRLPQPFLVKCQPSLHSLEERRRGQVFQEPFLSHPHHRHLQERPSCHLHSGHHHHSRRLKKERSTWRRHLPGRLPTIL